MKGLVRVKQINNMVIYKRDDGNFIVVNPKEKDAKKKVLCFSPNLADIEAFCKQRKELVILRGHNVHVGDIVVMCRTKQLGTIVTDHDDKNKWRFLPVNYGRYSSSQLTEIIAKDVRPATHEEKITYLKRDFTWGKIQKVHEIGDILIFEYVEKEGFRSDGEKPQTLYSGYVNLSSIHVTFHTLDQAIMGCMSYKYTNDTTAGDYFFRMIRK